MGSACPLRHVVRSSALWLRLVSFGVSCRCVSHVALAHSGSGLQVRQVAKVLESLGVGQRVHILHGPAVDHITYRELGELA